MFCFSNFNVVSSFLVTFFQIPGDPLSPHSSPNCFFPGVSIPGFIGAVFYCWLLFHHFFLSQLWVLLLILTVDQNKNIQVYHCHVLNVLPVLWHDKIRKTICHNEIHMATSPISSTVLISTWSLVSLAFTVHFHVSILDFCAPVSVTLKVSLKLSRASLAGIPKPLQHPPKSQVPKASDPHNQNLDYTLCTSFLY